MFQARKFKQLIALFSFFVSCFLFVVAGAAAIGVFSFEKQDVPPVPPPLIVEPNLLDFQEVDEGEHEGIVHFVNQSDRNICFLFAKSSCSCGVLELPGTPIAPGEKRPVKCALSTIGRTGHAGGVILIAYRFCDSNKEDSPPMYVSVDLRAVVNNGQ